MDAKDAIRSSANLSSMVLKTYISDLEDADLMLRPGEGCNHLSWQLGLTFETTITQTGMIPLALVLTPVCIPNFRSPVWLT